MSPLVAPERPADAREHIDPSPAPAPLALYHYTCVHSLPGIERDRLILPHRHPLFRVPLVWLTDLYPPDRHALGLTSTLIKCDRTVVRVIAAAGASAIAQPWGRWAHDHHVPRLTRELLEDGALPAHWWVSTEPVPVSRIQHQGNRHA